MQNEKPEYVSRYTPAGGRDFRGVWLPADWEHAPCCDTISQPSRKHPNNLLRHCYTKGHIDAITAIRQSEKRRTNSVEGGKG